MCNCDRLYASPSFPPPPPPPQFGIPLNTPKWGMAKGEIFAHAHNYLTSASIPGSAPVLPPCLSCSCSMLPLPLSYSSSLNVSPFFVLWLFRTLVCLAAVLCCVLWLIVLLMFPPSLSWGCFTMLPPCLSCRCSMLRLVVVLLVFLPSLSCGCFVMLPPSLSCSCSMLPLSLSYGCSLNVAPLLFLWLFRNVAPFFVLQLFAPLFSLVAVLLIMLPPSFHVAVL